MIYNISINYQMQNFSLENCFLKQISSSASFYFLCLVGSQLLKKGINLSSVTQMKGNSPKYLPTNVKVSVLQKICNVSLKRWWWWWVGLFT